jgi:Sugar-specific transcriptional regulator TrmB
MEHRITMEHPEALERLFPAFHGQNAKILAYLALRGVATAEQVSKELNMPRSTTYKLCNELVKEGLATEMLTTNEKGFRAADFVILVKNLAYAGELKITAKNVLAFDAAHTPAGRMFIERHGVEKFARFVELYSAYEDGTLTAQIMARDLGVIRFEVESLLSDIRALLPLAPEHRHQNRR